MQTCGVGVDHPGVEEQVGHPHAHGVVLKGGLADGDEAPRGDARALEVLEMDRGAEKRAEYAEYHRGAENR